jgi:hypothetical protein
MGAALFSTPAHGFRLEGERAVDMLRLLLHWILNAAALLIVSHFVAGFHIGSIVSALIAVIVIGLFNATLGFSSRSSRCRSAS